MSRGAHTAGERKVRTTTRRGGLETGLHGQGNASIQEEDIMASASKNDPQQPVGRLLTIAEVAETLGVDIRHVRRLVHERRIPYIKWGHLLRFDPAEITDWIDAYRRRPRGGV